MSDQNKLYKKIEIPDDLKHRGMFMRFGNEILFSPFNGPAEVPFHPPLDWKCEHCGAEWYISHIVRDFKSHCHKCGAWIGMDNINRGIDILIRIKNVKKLRGFKLR